MAKIIYPYCTGESHTFLRYLAVALGKFVNQIMPNRFEQLLYSMYRPEINVGHGADWKEREAAVNVAEHLVLPPKIGSTSIY